MSVPDFQTLMLPLLQLAADGHEHRLSEAIEFLAQQYHLSEADRRELLPSGKQSKFVNRVGWSATYLRKTKLLEGTGKGRFRITERGLAELRANPQRIDLRYLDKYPELATFRRGAQLDAANNGEAAVEAIEQTPREVLETSYQLLRRELAQELLEQIKALQDLPWERIRFYRIRTAQMSAPGFWSCRPWVAFGTWLCDRVKRGQRTYVSTAIPKEPKSRSGRQSSLSSSLWTSLWRWAMVARARRPANESAAAVTAG